MAALPFVSTSNRAHCRVPAATPAAWWLLLLFGNLMAPASSARVRYVGYARWAQNCASQNDAAQDAAMNAACHTLVQGSVAATYQDVRTSNIHSLPSSLRMPTHTVLAKAEGVNGCKPSGARYRCVAVRAVVRLRRAA